MPYLTLLWDKNYKILKNHYLNKYKSKDNSLNNSLINFNPVIHTVWNMPHTLQSYEMFRWGFWIQTILSYHRRCSDGQEEGVRSSWGVKSQGSLVPIPFDKWPHPQQRPGQRETHVRPILVRYDAIARINSTIHWCQHVWELRKDIHPKLIIQLKSWAILFMQNSSSNSNLVQFYSSKTHHPTQILCNFIHTKHILLIAQLFCNFAQSTTVSLPCYVQNFKMIR